MEAYEEVEGNASNAYDAYDAPDATTTREEDLNQPVQIEGVEVQGNHWGDLKALKTTSGNAEKRLRTRQETRSTTNSRKTAGAAIKQRSTLVKKERMKAWKQAIMQEVAQEIEAIRQMYKEALQTQRDNFRVELDRVNERLYQLNAQSPTCENEITSSETQKYATNKRPIQDAPKVSIPGPSTPAVLTQDLRETTLTSGPSQPIQEKQHSYTAIAASKPAQAASQP